MPLRSKILLTALIGLAVPHMAQAELYISPVLKDKVSHSSSSAASASATRPAQTVRAPTVQTPTAVAAVSPAVQAPIQKGDLFGRNVPLQVALENLVPNSKLWGFSFEPGTDSIKVSWKEAADWRAAINQISQAQGLSIAVNDPVARIGVARTAEMAKKLSEPGNDAWHLSNQLSLRANLDAWAKKAKWSVKWNAEYIDYPVEQAATLIGAFAGSGGTVDRVMQATAAHEVPLRATFDSASKTVSIAKGR